MKTKHILFALATLALVPLNAQSESPKVILITLDGLRWQELYTGADPALIAHKDYVGDTTELKAAFWRETPEERRKALLPFIWSEVVTMGQLRGNRSEGSLMNLTNSMWFSYPGYNEILTGRADDTRIDSNNKIPNPNVTLLEAFANTTEGKGKVAAFGSWDVFPFIINEERSGVPVNAGFETATGQLTAREEFLNQLQGQIPSPWGSVRLDAFTHHYALEYMKKARPHLVYIAYGETDDFAHDGDYAAYLKSARNTDDLIRELWEFTLQDEFYRDQTVFVITTDHGRGTEPLDSWRSHGSNVAGADQVWLIAFGAGVEPLGESKAREQLYSNQIAPSVARILNLDWPGEPLPGIGK